MLENELTKHEMMEIIFTLDLRAETLEMRLEREDRADSFELQTINKAIAILRKSAEI